MVLYSGSTASNGVVYESLDLTSLMFQNPVDGIGFLLINFPSDGIQNGPRDGMALVDNSQMVVQFLSYEGVMTAGEGPAAGMTSIDIGVSESGTTPVGFSLQLTGTGSVASDFVFAPEASITPRFVNNGQTIVMPSSPSMSPSMAPSMSPTDFMGKKGGGMDGKKGGGMDGKKGLSM
jgi:hypothetical protein